MRFFQAEEESYWTDGRSDEAHHYCRTYHESLENGRGNLLLLLDGESGTCQGPNGSAALKLPLDNEIQDERDGPEASAGGDAVDKQVPLK